MNPMDATAELVNLARRGNREAYDRLFARTADRLLLFIRLRLGPALRARLDSLDVLQEAYLEAHRALGTFEPEGDGAFARWLCRIAENRIRGLADHHGALKRQGGQARPITELLEWARATGTGPVTAAARREGRERLERALERLDPEESDVLVRRFFEDRSLDEIADLTGRSASAVRRLLGKAMLRLGKELKDAARR